MRELLCIESIKEHVNSRESIAENLACRIVVSDDVFTDPRLHYPAETAEEGMRRLIEFGYDGSRQ